MAPHGTVGATHDALWPGLRPRVLAAVDRLAGRRPVLLGLDGRSGSGKTDLARCLLRALAAEGLTRTAVHLDDLYPGWSGLSAGLDVLCEGVVTPLSRGLDGGYRSWDWHAGAPGRLRRVPARQVVLLEGVGTLCGPCAGLLDLRIWLEAPPDERRRRALARDGDTFAPHWRAWAAQEDALLAGSTPPADVVADTVTGRVRWSTLGP